MTTQTTPRYGFSMSLMVVALVALAIAGSVWAQGSTQPTMSGGTRMDVSALMMITNTADLPVEYFADPF